MGFSCKTHGWSDPEKPCKRCDEIDELLNGKLTSYEQIELLARCIISVVEAIPANDPALPYVTTLANRILELCK